MTDHTLSIALLSDIADEAGVDIEYVHAGQRRWRLIQSGRGTRAFATARALESELHYLASLRASDRAHKQPAVQTAARSVDTHAGRVEHAREHSTCFACRHYSLPLQSLSGFCKLGAPDWAHNGNNTLRWDNTCNRYEKD